MQITVISGKGGTGKTTVATNLAYISNKLGNNTCYADLDVEAPNGAIFLKPSISTTTDVTILIPEVDDSKCISCGLCSEICRYGAISFAGKKVEIFPNLCHSCGGCYLVCPTNAISENEMRVGQIEYGKAYGFDFYQGKLDIGKREAVRIIDELNNILTEKDSIIFADASPGTTCPVVSACRNADFVLAVTDPTPFGISDLKLTLDMIKRLSIPLGIFINRSDIGDLYRLESLTRSRNIPILGKLNYSREIAENYSSGKLLTQISSDIEDLFIQLFDRLKGMVK